jgi:hypothetical protein
MKRRSFLKLIGLATVWASSLGASGVAASAQSPTRSASALAAATSARFKADGGRVYISSDNGKSWTLHTYLGPEYAIQRVATNGSGVRLTVGYLGRSFGLVLASNQRSWLTV